MRPNVTIFMRVYTAALVCLLLWAVWSTAAQTTVTNTSTATAAGSTNAAQNAYVPTVPNNAFLTFGLDRVELLRSNSLMGIPAWQYVASLIYIFLAFYVSKLLDELIRVRLKDWARKTSTPFDDLVLDLLNGPVKIVSFVILLHIGLRVFVWPFWVAEFLSKGLKLVVGISITYMAVKLVDLMLGYWKQRALSGEDRSFDDLLFPIIRKSLRVFVIVVAALVITQNLGLNITSILAGLSVGGLALGLAAQDTVANLFGAVAVLMDKPFKIGDRIKLTEVDGMVESIGLRSTRVRNLDGHLITVPNKTMGNATITNVTLRPNIKTEMNIGLVYETSTEKLKQAIQILETTYRGHPKTQDLIVSFNQFADSSLNILVVHWWGDTDQKAYLAGMQQLNLSIKEQFDREGIGFAFPSRTVYLKKEA